jgi:hypothetical protein
MRDDESLYPPSPSPCSCSQECPSTPRKRPRRPSLLQPPAAPADPFSQGEGEDRHRSRVKKGLPPHANVGVSRAVHRRLPRALAAVARCENEAPVDADSLAPGSRGLDRQPATPRLAETSLVMGKPGQRAKVESARFQILSQPVSAKDRKRTALSRHALECTQRRNHHGNRRRCTARFRRHRGPQLRSRSGSPTPAKTRRGRRPESMDGDLRLPALRSPRR